MFKNCRTGLFNNFHWGIIEKIIFLCRGVCQGVSAVQEEGSAAEEDVSEGSGTLTGVERSDHLPSGAWNRGVSLIQINYQELSSLS